MVLPATEVYNCLSLIIFVCTVLCFAECGRCPREVVGKPFNYDVCSSGKGFYYGLPNSYSSYRNSDYGSEHQKRVPLDDNACHRSESLRFPSALYGFQSKAQCSRERNLRSGFGCALPKKSIRSDGNVSWSPNDVVFRLLDGGIVKCSLNFRELGLEELPPSVSGVDQIAVSSCRGHLLAQMETNFNLRNIEIQKSPFSEHASPHVNISPTKLNWGQIYIYHSSVASLRLKNTCNESVLTVYKLFSTDSQFYPFNFSEVVLGPGQITSITFAYLPSRLGYSSAELVLLTSLGGFLVEANGFAVESPLKLKPVVGFDASSGWRLSRKLSLSNPFDEIIDLEEVTSLFSVFEGSGTLLVESICRKQNFSDSNQYSFSNGDDKQSEPMVLAIKPLNNWLISPHKTRSILEMAFLPDSKGKVVGAICMEVLRPVEGEKDMLVVPFEAELNKTESWKDTASPLLVSVEAIGPCDANETMFSISIRNRASHLLKIVEVNEIVDIKNLFQITYLEGLLLFPGTITQVALVTYESSKVEYDSFLEMPDVSINCKVEIQVNDSSIPHLEVPCLEIFGICPLRQQKLLSHMIDIDDPSNREQPMPGVEKFSILTQGKGYTYLHDGWRARCIMDRPCLLDTDEILFPHVAIGDYYAKSITINNPSDQPVIVQLILNSGETVDNCKTRGHQQSLFPSSSICNDSSGISRPGFSFSDITVTEAFLHPHGTGSLGPILFHPSNRCEWKSSVFIRSNLSGLELLSLHGFGGSLSLVMLEGTEAMQSLHFNMNFPFPPNTSDIEKINSCCRKPLLKKLSAVNDGDFPVLVERIDVSGRECGLDGFVVHNCGGFSLKPGESMELGLSYQSEFSMPLVQRELELILDVGTIIIPMQASLALDVLSLCKQAIFWSDMKRYFWAIVLTVVLLFLLFWHTIHYQGTEKIIEKINTDHVKQGIITGRINLDSRTEINPSSEDVKEVTLSSSSPFKTSSGEKSRKVELAAQPACLTVKTRKGGRKRRSSKKNALIEVSSSHSGNSTPTSPLSPVTTLTPPEACSLSLEKRQPRDSFSPEPVVSAIRVPERQNQEFPGGSWKVGNRAMFTPSATFPGVMRNPPSRLAIDPHARAPGTKIHSQNAVQLDKNTRAENDRFTYDIWGDHLSGIHLCKENGSITMPSGTLGDSFNSFFLRGPRQTLMNNYHPPSVSKFCDDG